jgi:hypothetical protein
MNNHATSSGVIRAVARVWRHRGVENARALAHEHEMPLELLRAIGCYVRVDWPSVESSKEYDQVQRAHASEHAAELPGDWKFPPGRVAVTAGAVNALQPTEPGEAPQPFDQDRLEPLIGRHLRGDWGEVDSRDSRENDRALLCGGRLLSAYEHDGQRFFVITEWDRSTTTVMLREEY